MSPQSSKPRKHPVIGIDPGRCLAFGVHPGPGRSPTGGFLLDDQPWQSAFDPWLPAYLFIEQPTGRDFAIRSRMGKIVDRYLNELAPFNRQDQLVPNTVWRKEVLGAGNANKHDAIEFAKGRYPSFTRLDANYHDIAEALCIMEYGRRFVEGRLEVVDTRAKSPRYELQPGAPRTLDTSLKYEFDRYDGRWSEFIEPPWLLLHTLKSPELAGILRVWASCYRAVTTHCEEHSREFSGRALRKDARVSPNQLDAYVQKLVLKPKQGSPAYRDRDFIVFRALSEYEARTEITHMFSNLVSQYLGHRQSKRLMKAWLEEDTAEPGTLVHPSNWKKQEDRKHHDRRWGRMKCEDCGTYAGIEEAFESNPLCKRCSEADINEDLDEDDDPEVEEWD